MSDYDRFIDYTTYDIDLIRHERSVKGVISNSISTVLTDIAPLIRVFDQQGTDYFLNLNLFMHLPRTVIRLLWIDR